MSKVRLTGATSGFTEITTPAVAGNNTVTLPSSGTGSLIASSDTGTVSTAMLASAAITVPKLSTAAAGTGVGFVRDASSDYVISQAPNGTKVAQCWGQGTTSASGYVTINLPVTMTNADYGITVTSYGIILGGFDINFMIGAVFANSFQIYSTNGTTLSSFTFKWVAVGVVT